MDDNMSYDESIKDERQHEITIKSRRVDPPSHYAFQIDSYSVLSEIEMKKCESGDFEVDGYMCKASNGFLVNNSCTFGVEVSILKASNKGERLTIFREPQQDTYFWTLYSFSAKTNQSYISEPFNVKGRKWRMEIYPNGNSLGKTSHISLYLKLDNSETIPLGKKIYAKFLLGVYNFSAKKYIDKSYEHWFKTPGHGDGFDEFLSRREISTHSQNDAFYLKARIVAMSTVDEF
ncbi:hypothetical protein IC582_017160 [Cucumis melo]|uniref:Ubiquitin C-terminal hydrolase 12-like isoform X2 n=1 Tax=Cucumis melo TaxID=3656 RepID=A0A1S3BWR3_CUCME|nr:ubiquitin C-terminal hydrolase 12-like isoform X2 [Cucumis melo]